MAGKSLIGHVAVRPSNVCMCLPRGLLFIRDDADCLCNGLIWLLTGQAQIQPMGQVQNIDLYLILG